MRYALCLLSTAQECSACMPEAAAAFSFEQLRFVDRLFSSVMWPRGVAGNSMAELECRQL